MPTEKKKLHWVKLDNAAKIYPAARNQNWSNVFRVSATLKGEIDLGQDEKAKALLAMLANLKKGQKLGLRGMEIKEGETSPPKRYTSGSMILAMENAGQLIDRIGVYMGLDFPAGPKMESLALSNNKKIG